MALKAKDGQAAPRTFHFGKSQVDSHPSASILFPSSHSSLESNTLSPQEEFSQEVRHASAAVDLHAGFRKPGGPRKELGAVHRRPGMEEVEHHAGLHRRRDRHEYYQRASPARGVFTNLITIRVPSGCRKGRGGTPACFPGHFWPAVGNVFRETSCRRSDRQEAP